MLGDALPRPGLLLRREALARASRRAVELAVGAAPVLIVAGLIEGFVSPSDLPIEVKLAFGPLAGLVLYALLLTVGTRSGSGEPAAPQRPRPGTSPASK